MPRVFTNGCFDLLHPGHIETLKFAHGVAWEGGAADNYCYPEVIVGLNSDRSVMELKGPERPIFDEQSRKTMLESIKYVDRVIIFQESTPYELIKKINPDVIVKGGHYSGKTVVGEDLAEVTSSGVWQLYDKIKGPTV